MKCLIALAVASTFFLAVPSVAADQNEISKQEVRIASLKYHSDFDSTMTLVKRKDYDKAFNELLRFAKYGEKRAQYLTGVFYISGYGTKVDAGEGLAWIKLALEQDTTEWRQSYMEMTDSLTDKQLEVIESRYQQLKEMYGAEKQFMHCKLEKAKWSNIIEPICKKELFQRSFYKVNQFG